MTKILLNSIVDTFSAQQQQELQSFVQEVYKAKILNDIYKMLFTRGVFARFLAAAEFNQKIAL